jgi:hypothetical protein
MMAKTTLIWAKRKTRVVLPFHFNKNHAKYRTHQMGRYDFLLCLGLLCQTKKSKSKWMVR